MGSYTKESHLRSIIKGVSWRIVATIDTIVIVLAITCLTSTCSIENALKIGIIEFLIKLIAYYFHERIWLYSPKNRIKSKRLTLYKTISWRILATAMTFIISGTILKAFDEIALFIALTELFTKFALYYFHERLWLKIPLGQIRKLALKPKK